MKILLLNQVFYPDPVSTAQHATDIARYLRVKGHEVTVLAGQRDYERRSLRYPKRESFHGIEIRRISSTGFGKRSFVRRFVDSLTFELSLLWELVRVPRHDVVVSFTSPPLIGVVGALYCRLRGGRSVQWLMDINPDMAIELGYLNRDSWVARVLNRLFERSLEWSQNIVVLDRWMKARVVRHGVPEEKVTIIPPWPVQEPMRHDTTASASTNPFRQAFGLQDKFVVLYSGNHSLVHPLDTLLEAAVRMRNEKGVFFVFVGGGVRVRDVRAVAQRHGLTNILQLPHQPREMLPLSLTSADLHVVVMGNAASGLVHTSKIYGILATGLPYVFIGPRNSHMSDLLKECPHGSQVAHGQVDELVEVIQNARRYSPRQRAEISRQNVQHLLSHYTMERALDKFLSEVLLGESLSRGSGEGNPPLEEKRRA